MRRLFALLLGILFGGTLMYTAFQFHVVRTSDKVLLVKKRQTSLQDVYVDIRNWTFREWRAHRPLADALVAAGHADLVRASYNDGFLQDFFSKIRQPPWFAPSPKERVPNGGGLQ
jgi:hypothetical protein